MRNRCFRARLPIAIVASFYCTIGVGQVSAYESDRVGSGRSPFICREWQVDDGLPQSYIEALGKTRDGYLWMGTSSGGPVRFDGVAFTRLSEISPGYAALVKRDDGTTVLIGAADGGLWIGSAHGGLVHLHGDGRVSAYSTAEGLSHESVLSAFEGRDGVFWVGTKAGLCRVRDGRVEAVNEPEGPGTVPITALCEDPGGTLWVGTKGRGMFRRAEGRWTLFDDQTGEGLSTRDINALLRDSSGRLWVATTGGLYRLEGGQFQAFLQRQGLDQTVLSLGEDRQGTLWVGMLKETLIRRADDTFEPIAVGEGKQHHYTLSLLCDNEGGTWAGTMAGLFRFRPREVETFSVAEGLSGSLVTTVCPGPNGVIWATNGGGLNRINRDSTVTVFGAAEGLPTNGMTALHVSRDGDVWVGSWGSGLFRFRDGRSTRYTEADGLSSNIIRSVLETRDGTVWIGTWGGGLARFRDGRFTTLRTRDGLGSDRVRALLEDRQGRLWVGTVAGLSRIEGDQITTYTARDGLASDSIFCLYEDGEGVLWIGTSGGGLARLEDGRFRTYTTRDGLLDDTVTQILEDDSGNLWMGSPRGIFRVSKRLLRDHDAGRPGTLACLSYGRNEGMRSCQCSSGSQPAGCRSSDGRLWFATINGLAIVDPAHATANDIPPPTTVESVLVDGKATVGGTVDRPGRGDLEFRYTACSFGDPVKVRFRYRLEGFDAGWVDAGTRRVAFYTNVPPGQYRFRVRACNDDGLWDEVGVSAQLTLQPHFYQTVWFGTACGAGVPLLLGAAYRKRMAASRKRERELKRLVGERTAELEDAKVELEARNERLAELAATDALTGLWNRRHFLEKLGSTLPLAVLRGRPTSVLMLDVDLFKSYNDSFGHPAGDAALQVVAAVLQARARENDVAARYGGEEFIVLLPGTDAADAERVAERLRSEIESARWPQRPVTASFGVATADGDQAIDAALLLSAADRALYRAKRSGRNRVVHHDSGEAGHRDIECPSIEVDEPSVSVCS